jgi:23S rRNA pseudouridine2604 synthase
MEDEGVRLAKRVAAQVPCSRAEAERYIAGGWVSVDGAVAEDPAARVTDEQRVALLPGATAIEPVPVTILLHKPAGMGGEAALALLTADRLEGKQRVLKRHLSKLTLTNPLEDAASGLLVYTQDFRVARKLVQEVERVEQEYVVEVAGSIRAGGLELLNHGLSFQGRAVAPLKVSWQSENRLRFAGKGIRAGQVGYMCGEVDLDVTSMKRLRIGRQSLAGLPEGRWRYLGDFERF